MNNADMKKQLDEIVQDDVKAYRYVVLKAKYQNMILVMDASGHIVGEVKAPYLLFNKYLFMACVWSVYGMRRIFKNHKKTSCNRSWFFHFPLINRG